MWYLDRVLDVDLSLLQLQLVGLHFKAQLVVVEIVFIYDYFGFFLRGIELPPLHDQISRVRSVFLVDMINVWDDDFFVAVWEVKLIRLRHIQVEQDERFRLDLGLR